MKATVSVGTTVIAMGPATDGGWSRAGFIILLEPGIGTHTNQNTWELQRTDRRISATLDTVHGVNRWALLHSLKGGIRLLLTSLHWSMRGVCMVTPALNCGGEKEVQLWNKRQRGQR